MNLKAGPRVSPAFPGGRRDVLPYSASFMIRQDGRETWLRNSSVAERSERLDL